jgi:hypothetical protein
MPSPKPIAKEVSAAFTRGAVSVRVTWQCARCGGWQTAVHFVGTRWSSIVEQVAASKEVGAEPWLCQPCRRAVK